MQSLTEQEKENKLWDTVSCSRSWKADHSTHPFFLSEIKVFWYQQAQKGLLCLHAHPKNSKMLCISQGGCTPMSPVQVENALLSHLTYAPEFQPQSILQHADSPPCGPVASWTGAMASCTAYNQEKIYWWISLLSQQIRNQTIISHGQATYGEKQIKMEHGGPGQMVQKSKAIIALPEVPGSVLNTQVAAQSHL